MSGPDSGAGSPPAPPPLAPPPGSRPQHPHSFKLLFAPPREPGRSDVSLVKPLGLPATVADKFYARAPRADSAERRRQAAAERRVTDMFRRGPRDKHPHPLTTQHEYGWWAGWARADEPALRHHIRDSWWLRERLRVLAADQRPR